MEKGSAQNPPADRDGGARVSTVSPVHPATRRSRKRSATHSVTLSDVAAAAGVSAQTVSRVIREPGSVAEDTRVRVETAIAETGYVRNLTASGLASNRSHTVAAVIPLINASVFADTVHAFEERLRAHGYQIFVGATEYEPGREEELVASFLGRRPDGFLLVGTEHTARTVELVRGAGVPVVETWGWTDEPIDLLVGLSHADATAALVQHLVERGRRRITFASRQLSGDPRSAERLEGYTRAVADLLGTPPRTVATTRAGVTMDVGVELLDLALAEFPDSDAVMFSSDVYAAGALLACVRRGIDVPGQLAVTGFGDFELARHLVPGLTTVAVPSTEIGAQAADLLLARMHAQPVPAPVRDVGFEVRVRAST